MPTELAFLVVLGTLGFAVGTVLRKGIEQPSSREPIVAPRYPVVEVMNAVLWVSAGIRFGAHPAIVPYLVLFSVLLELSVIDLEQYVLPNRVVYPAILFALVSLPVAAILVGRPRAIVGLLVGC